MIPEASAFRSAIRPSGPSSISAARRSNCKASGVFKSNISRSDISRSANAVRVSLDSLARTADRRTFSLPEPSPFNARIWALMRSGKAGSPPSSRFFSADFKAASSSPWRAAESAIRRKSSSVASLESVTKWWYSTATEFPSASSRRAITRAALGFDASSVRACLSVRIACSLSPAATCT